MKQVENLDKLAEEIYKEGIEKAKKDSEDIILDARKQSDKIIKDAEQKANEIIQKCEKEAEKINRSTLNEVSLKSKQIISDLKESIKTLIVKENLDKHVGKIFEDKEFIVQLILSISKKWSSSKETELIIDSEYIKNLDSYLGEKLKDQLKGMEIKTSEIPIRGFQIKNTKEGYYVSFSDVAFIEFLKPYFSDRIQKMLFES
jgi:V/A-type H+-transporting ATPase subunit E